MAGGEIRKAQGHDFWIVYDPKTGKYYPCQTKLHAMAMIISPSLHFIYSQDMLKKLFRG